MHHQPNPDPEGIQVANGIGADRTAMLQLSVKRKLIHDDCENENISEHKLEQKARRLIFDRSSSVLGRQQTTLIEKAPQETCSAPQAASILPITCSGSVTHPNTVPRLGLTDTIIVAASDNAVGESLRNAGIPHEPGRSSWLTDQNNSETLIQLLVERFQEYYNDNDFWTKNKMRAARTGVKAHPKPTINTAIFDLYGETSFGPVSTTTPNERVMHMEYWPNRGKGSNKKMIKQKVSAKTTLFATPMPDMPPYIRHTPIKDNIFGHNAVALPCWPSLGAIEQGDNAAREIEKWYFFKPRDREKSIVQRLKGMMYKDYLQSALHELSCTWGDVLKVLLECDDRNEEWLEGFCRVAKRWKNMIQALPTSAPDRLSLAKHFCLVFYKLTGLSIWHVARLSDLCSSIEVDDFYRQSKNDNNDQSDFSYFAELHCRICLRFDCIRHGEMLERPKNESTSWNHLSDDGQLKNDVVSGDIVNPPNVNYLVRVSCRIEALHVTNGRVQEKTTITTSARGEGIEQWRKRFTEPSERHVFYPCHHPGLSCEIAQCSCVEARITCEKTCRCIDDCNRRFPGCTCSAQQNQRCMSKKSCACYGSGRECDPDLCGGCGVRDVLDTMNRHDDNILEKRCRNASIQRGITKVTLIGRSGVHGYGSFACEDMRKGDFVSEYVGELIQIPEGDRRAAIYALRQVTYEFNLNGSQCLDGTHFGNETRFINNARGDAANLEGKTMLVNGVHRIGLYARRTIKHGEELFFDYGADFGDDHLGGMKSTVSAPHVRLSKNVEEPCDVAHHSDERGVKRARRRANNEREMRACAMIDASFDESDQEMAENATTHSQSFSVCSAVSKSHDARHEAGDHNGDSDQEEFKPGQSPSTYGSDDDASSSDDLASQR